MQDRLTKVRNEIIEKSPYSKEETNEILAKYYTCIPVTVQLLIGKYSFDSMKVLEIGSNYGSYLLYWGETSEGIEVQPHMAKFTEALGRRTYILNVEDGFTDVIPMESYDAISTNNLIEHLVAPHLFLARLHRLLKPGGFLAIGHPVVPPVWIRSIWKRLGYKGWLAVEHINFFTPTTIKLMLERSGFRVVDQYFPGFARIHPIVSRACVRLGVQCLSVCQKIEGFKYPSKRIHEFDPQYAISDLTHFR